MKLPNLPLLLQVKMAKSRQILNTIDTESKLEKQRAALLPKSGPSAEYLERMEEEKYKTESTKTHERYRRKQMAVGEQI